ncbi:MAG: Rpn family recombination-promoting nuclease/putative transposase [Puniceicoccales bacterium]|jgi:predicted transposase/invertase (TIGR01784 family)|nr:Rpn family recombination-promoting nuclease/putative transposase [Puniceicoccales bacterium]
MSCYLDPKADITFKRVFAQRKDLCISLLNALLPLAPDAQIVSIEYLPSEVLPFYDGGKNTVADIRCTDQHDRQFIVEMQMAWTSAFMQRIVFSASRAYVNQLKAGDDYPDLKPVYLLTLLNTTYLSDTPDAFHDYQICENGTNHVIEGVRWAVVELPKFRPSTSAQKRYFTFWLRYFTEITDKIETVPADLLEIPEIRDAIESLEIGAYSPAERATYENYWDNVRYERTLMRGKFTEGKIEGIAEGEAKGKIEGEAKGITETNRRNALAMKNKGYPLPDIAEITGLPLSEIEKLAQNPSEQKSELPH